MQQNIKATDLELTEELRSYVERRLTQHADKFLSNDSTAHADVELEYSSVRDGGQYRAEFTVEASGDIYRASEWGTTMHEAIDVAVAELGRELRQEKKMRMRSLRHGALKVKEYIRGWRNKI